MRVVPAQHRRVEFGHAGDRKRLARRASDPTPPDRNVLARVCNRVRVLALTSVLPMSGMTRGPLPARVYWVRRLMVLGIAVLLVVGIAKLLGGSSDGSSGDDAARNVAATSSATGGATPGDSSTGEPSSYGPSAKVTGTGQHHRAKKADDPVTPVAMPSGPCAASDVAITPSVPKPIAGRDISLVLDLTSLNTPACTWKLSGRTIALKITSGNDLIWTTNDCARAVPTQDLVLRQSQPTRVTLTWDARRSEPGCPVRTEWALPGTYHLHVAALAGRPQDVTFLLTAPSPPEVIRTAHSHNGHHKKHPSAG